MKHDMRVLVCEGPCSPLTGRFDIAARCNDRDMVVRLAPHLVHTAHSWQGHYNERAAYYKCEDCGTIRKF